MDNGRWTIAGGYIWMRATGFDEERLEISANPTIDGREAGVIRCDA
jgi:hypothetical protein